MTSYTASPDAHDTLAHPVPVRVLAAVFAALLVLTGVTVAVANVDLGNLNLYVALAIAGLKASLVVLYFMHLRYDRPFLLVVFLGCLAFVVLFISLVLTDTAAYAPSMKTGQAPNMQKVHTPFGR
jgi:cytochrome c oxidase subunit IV